MLITFDEVLAVLSELNFKKDSNEPGYSIWKHTISGQDLTVPNPPVRSRDKKGNGPLLHYEAEVVADLLTNSALPLSNPAHIGPLTQALLRKVSAPRGKTTPKSPDDIRM